MEAWAVALTVLGLFGGLGRWLLGYWFKSQREIQNLKSNQLASAISTLRDEITTHKVSISQLVNRLGLLEQKIQFAIAKLEDLKVDLKETNLNLKEFQKRIEEKQDRLASENIRIAKELVLVRSTLGNKNAV